MLDKDIIKKIDKQGFELYKKDYSSSKSKTPTVLIVLVLIGLLLFFLTPTFTGLVTSNQTEENITLSLTENITTIEENTTIESTQELIQTSTQSDQTIILEEDTSGELTITTDQTFSTQSIDIRTYGDADTHFNPNLDDGDEIRREGFKYANRSSVMISSYEGITCRLKPDSQDDGLKDCELILDLESFRAHNPDYLV